MPRTHRRLLTATVSMVVALVAAAGLTACEPPPDTYVALGDSYVSGPLIPNQSLKPLGCLRSTNNYPAQVRPNIRVTKFVDVSCSGAKTTNLRRSQSVEPGPANPPQLDPLNRMTKVVTLGMGGNDIGFSDIVKNCGVWAPGRPACKSGYVHDGRDEISEAIAALRPKFDQGLSDIKTRAPRAKVFVAGYPTVVPETGTGCYPLVTISPTDIVYLRAKVKELNATIKASTEAAGGTYIDLATPSIGHDFCQLPTRKWVEGLVPTATAAPVHPNRLGMNAFAPIVAAEINAVVTR